VENGAVETIPWIPGSVIAVAVVQSSPWATAVEAANAAQAMPAAARMNFRMVENSWVMGQCGSQGGRGAVRQKTNGEHRASSGSRRRLSRIHPNRAQ
jgi:hypothetical protein